MSQQILDLRDLADNWQEAIDADEWQEASDTPESAFTALCDDLGIDRTPEALKDYGDLYEPTLIADSYFTEYAQELAEDCAPFTRSSETAQILESWPYRCIDWEYAARELKYDYSHVQFDGDDYYIRSV